MQGIFDIASKNRCSIGEHPLWHPEEQRLYWCCVQDGTIYRLDPKSGEQEAVYEGDLAGGFTFQSDGSILLFTTGLRVLLIRDGEAETIVGGMQNDLMFNDVVADTLGGVFCGQLPAEGRPGNLYRLTTDGTLDRVIDRCGIPNGMGFSPDGEWFYFTDSTARRVFRYSFDTDTGEISDREVFAEFLDEPLVAPLPDDKYPVPDGLTVDDEGNVWVCLFGGEGLVRLAPDGSERRRIETPVKTATSLAFGGAELTDVFVTTGHLGKTSMAVEDNEAGRVYRTAVKGARGKPEYYSKVLV